MKEGMKIAVMIHPPAFGMTLKSFNADNAKQMPGVIDVFQIDAYLGDTQNSAFDIAAFRDLVVVVASAQTDLNINNVRARLLNGGDMWWDFSDCRYGGPNLPDGQ